MKISLTEQLIYYDYYYSVDSFSPSRSLSSLLILFFWVQYL